MVTPEQNRLNLASAKSVAEKELWPDGRPMTIAVVGGDYDLRVAFNRKLADVILRYPDRFRTETLDTARRVIAKTYEPLEDPGFSPSDFIGFVGENATGLLSDVAEVGTGVRRTFALAGWVIPAAALTVVGIFLWRLAKK